MHYTPEPYQLEGTLELLNNPHFGLLFDPGLGKTATVLHAIRALKLTKRTFRVLVIAPRLVCIDTWPAEIEKWNQFKSLSYIQLRDEKHLDIDRPENIWLTNPDLPRLTKLFGLIVQRLSRQIGAPFKSFSSWLQKPYQQKRFRDLLMQRPWAWPFDMLVVDESSKFKNSESKRFKVLRKFLPYFPRTAVLTGTFAPNGLGDIFSQMLIIDGGQTFGQTITGFREQYFQIDNPKYYTYKIKGPFEEDAIQKAIAPWVMQLDAETHLDLPKLIHNKIGISLPKKYQKQYDGMEKKFFTTLDDEGSILAPNSSAKYRLCRQMANGSFYDPDDIDTKMKTTIPFHKFKTERLQNLIDELNGKPLLVVYFYKSDMLQIQKDLKKKLPVIGGQTSETMAKRYIQRWNKKETPLLLAQYSSIAHGLNLQAGGNDICLYGLTDNLEDYEQVIRRVYRKGVKGQVRVHYLIVKKTIDVAMYSRIRTKERKERETLKAIQKYRRMKDDSNT